MTSPIFVLLLGLLSHAAAFAVTPRVAAVRTVVSQQSTAVVMTEGEAKSGTCKWFDVTKGYGFIAIEGDEKDIFVHQSDIYAPGFRSLQEGEALEFRVQADSKTGKLKAVEVTGPDGAYVQGAPRNDGGGYDDEYY